MARLKSESQLTLLTEMLAGESHAQPHLQGGKNEAFLGYAESASYGNVQPNQITITKLIINYREKLHYHQTNYLGGGDWT